MRIQTVKVKIDRLRIIIINRVEIVNQTIHRVIFLEGRVVIGSDRRHACAHIHCGIAGGSSTAEKIVFFAALSCCSAPIRIRLQVLFTCERHLIFSNLFYLNVYKY